MFPPMGGPSLPQSGSPLDGPPPSPQSIGGGPTGSASPASLSSIAPPVPSGQMPPEILTGILQSAGTVSQLFDSWAQALPDKAAQLAMLKDMLQRFLADVVSAGANPTSPTATGSAFPAAFDRGVSGAGTQ